MTDKIEFDGLDERFRGVPLLGGLLGGVLSFVVGYLSFLGIAARTGDGIDLDARSLRQVGQFFHNSFLVPTHQRTTQVIENEADGETVLQETVFDVRYNPFYRSDSIDVDQQVYLDGSLFDERSRSIAVENADGWALPNLTFPDFVYLAVPVVILVAVGFLFAFLFVSFDDGRAWPDVLVRSVVGGGTITLGFVLLAFAGTYLFTVDGVALFTAQTGEDVFTRPDRLETLLYGLAYPAVCATTGVLLGGSLRTVAAAGVERDDPTAADEPTTTGEEVEPADGEVDTPRSNSEA